jgi:hypothetical protein
MFWKGRNVLEYSGRDKKALECSGRYKKDLKSSSVFW